MIKCKKNKTKISQFRHWSYLHNVKDEKGKKYMYSALLILQFHSHKPEKSNYQNIKAHNRKFTI